MIVVPARGATSNSDRPVADSLEALIVDRQPLFMAALANLLEAPPLSAHVAITSRSDVALDMALTGGIDLIFCDVRAEPLSGVELVHALGSHGCGIPLVLLGDDGDEAQLAGALSTNVAGVFTKNSELDEFLVGVRAIVSGHRAIGSGLLGMLLDRGDRASMTESRGAASRLSPTELAILAMIGQAHSISAIAASRGISHKTVRNHLAKIYRKLELHGRTEAMLWAARMGLTG